MNNLSRGVQQAFEHLRVFGTFITRNRHGVYVACSQLADDWEPLKLSLLSVPGAQLFGRIKQGRQFAMCFLLAEDRPGVDPGDPLYEHNSGLTLSYRHNGYSGYSVSKADDGWYIHHWSLIPGERTRDSYFLPYGTLGLGPWDDLAAEHSVGVNNAAALWQIAREGSAGRCFRKGILVTQAMASRLEQFSSSNGAPDGAQSVPPHGNEH